MTKKTELPDKGDKHSDAVKAKVQGRVVEGSGILKKLNTLHDITSQIDNTRKRDEILNILRSEAKWVINYEVCFASLLNRAKTHYVINALSPIADASDLNHKHFSIDEGMPGWVIKKQASFIGDIESTPHFSQAIEGKIQDLGIQSLVIVPMRTGNEVIGSLYFGTIKKGFY